MARITLSGIRHTYASGHGVGEYALRNVDHAFEDGGAYALLGPSGCGKTTLLNIISGLVAPSEGRVLFGEEDVTRRPTEKRNIAQVFQFPVIYDSMTVHENLAFPLRNHGVKHAEAERRVDDVLRLIGLEHKARQRARGLTADEKQKISLGRGLVRADVKAILFDEPLTVIDPAMKWQLRTQLKEMHARFGHTMIYVTHDQTEALTFAQKVAVMYEGEIVQVGTPEDLFERPMHTFVGYFIGSPGMNLMPATLDGATACVGAHAVQLRVAPKVNQGKIELGVRPEYVRFSATGTPAQITGIEEAGRLRIVRARMEGCDIAAIAPENWEVPVDPRISFDPKGVNLYVDSRRVETGL